MDKDFKQVVFGGDNKFSRFMNTLADVLFVGILWLVCSVPIVTAGASATAAYYATAKCVRHKSGYVMREFFSSFRKNFKQTLPVSLAALAVFLVLVIDISYVWSNESTANNALFVILVFLAFLAWGLLWYFFPLLSRFDRKNGALFKISAVLFFKYLPLTLGSVLLFAAACTGVYLMPWALLVIPGVYWYLCSYPLERILKKLMPAVPEDSEEANKWYYQ